MNNTLSDSDIVNHVKQSIQLANNNESKLNAELLAYKGMSGIKGRHLLNNICNRINCRYLEIGIFQGSTFFSALYKNKINAVGIDNWSEFTHYPESKTKFFTNLDTYKGNNTVTVLDQDCWTATENDAIDNINVYFYDGGHSEESQYRALKEFFPKMADTFVVLIDDYTKIKGRTAVVNGTTRALNELPVEILFSQILGPEVWENKPQGYVKANEWWRSICVLILKKT